MRLILKYLGFFLLLTSLLRIIPLISAIFFKENLLWHFISILAFALPGVLLLQIKLQKDKNNTFGITEAFALTALSFILISILSATTFLPHTNYNFNDALFESVSGFTTTGLSIFDNVELLPKSVLLWRAQTQWIGGLGIVILFLFMFDFLRSDKSNSSSTNMKISSISNLFHANASIHKSDVSQRESITKTIQIYLMFTFGGFLLLWATGLSIFEALSIAFTAISTGGFSVTNSFYQNPFQLGIISLLMILGATSYVFHQKIFKKKFKEAFEKTQFRFFFLILFCFCAIAFMFLRDVKIVIFQIISSLTTTGFSITPHVEWILYPQMLIFLVMICMVIGGATGSTAGGIKTYRIWLLLKSIPWKIKKLTSPPNAIIPLKIKGEAIDEESALWTYVFFFAYILFLSFGILMFMVMGFDFFNSSFQVFSALGTVGLQSMSLATIPWVGKYILMILMLLGRLEIFPLLILVYKIFKK
ncbi:TrkH family potassium uptake protein [Candidatus Woesearchaeota archaeon]|jgi:trk system potassium uptake protein|nr:TrkH family potassium uptake protein [Candidatus Woesearchaeota archaeon]